MRLPFAILELNDELRSRWHAHFELPTDRNRKLEEGLWRRTQEASNAAESGWRDATDCRRRLIHYRYTYDTTDRDGSAALCLQTLYLMYCVTYPEDEVEAIYDSVVRSLQAGGWHQPPGTSVWERDDLVATPVRYSSHPMDIAHGRPTPTEYLSLELTIRSRNDPTSAYDKAMPWDVLRRGMRMKDRREDPVLLSDLTALAEYAPFHVEAGCGLSVESGVPPLHFLHDVYQVTDRTTDSFVLRAQQDDIVLRLLESPESVLPLLTHIYRACFVAEPSDTHRDLKKLADAGLLIGPVMTNNFDGLLQRVGLDELYLRRYDQDIPPVEFDPRARGLLVIGSHADRRRVQRRARERGLKVFFVDPEGFWDGDSFIPYPLEGIRREDFLCRQRASEAIPELVERVIGSVRRL